MKLESLAAIEVIVISDDDNNNDDDDIVPLASSDNTAPLASSNHAAPLVNSGKYNLFFILNFETYIINDYIIFFL